MIKDVRLSLRIQKLPGFNHGKNPKWRVLDMLPGDTFPEDCDFKGQRFVVKIKVDLNSAPEMLPGQEKPSRAAESSSVRRKKQIEAAPRIDK